MERVERRLSRRGENDREKVTSIINGCHASIAVIRRPAAAAAAAATLLQALTAVLHAEVSRTCRHAVEHSNSG